MKSFQEMHDLLMNDHESQYDHFTRLMLTLSVGFITFTTAIKSNEVHLYSGLHKAGIICHGLSILFGIWLQYALTKKPLDDLNKVAELFRTSDEIMNGKGIYFARPPSMVQKICFTAQIALFLAAFCMVIVNIVI